MLADSIQNMTGKSSVCTCANSPMSMATACTLSVDQQDEVEAVQHNKKSILEALLRLACSDKAATCDTSRILAASAD